MGSRDQVCAITNSMSLGLVEHIQTDLLTPGRNLVHQMDTNYHL